MEIEFVEVSGGTGNGLFSAKAEYLDKQVSKGVLGQTMSTDDGASLSQAKVHENVRHDIARADARQLAATANRDLIRPFVDLNFGPRDRYPTLVIPINEPEDLKALADVIAKLVPLGMELSMPKTRERFGFEDPDEVDLLLKAPAAKAAAPAAVDDGEEEDTEPEKPAPTKKPGEDDPATARLSQPCPHCGGYHAIASDERPELDQLVEGALEHWQRDTDPLFEPLRALFARAGSYEDLQTGLEDMAARTDAGPLADRIAKLLMKARGLGDLGEGR